MHEDQRDLWHRLPEYCERLGEQMRRRVDQRLWTKFDVSGFGNSIAADALLNQEQFHGVTDTEFFAWLRRIAQRKLLQKWRYWLDAEMRDVRREQSLSPADDSASPCLDTPVSLITPSKIAVRNEQAGLVNLALAAIEPEHAEVLTLYYAIGLTRREIAEILALNSGQVANRIRTALKRLREQLAHLGSEMSDG